MFKAIKHALNSYSVPKLDWNAEAEAAKYTPDYPHLIQAQWQVLFVYDEMQETFPYQHLLVGYKHRQVGFTHKKFSVWKKDLGRETVALALNKEYSNVPRAPLAPVMGTLYLLPAENFKAIDKHKLNTLQCQRTQVKIIVPSRRLDSEGINVSKKVRHDVFTAWMHVGIDAYWDEHLTNYTHSPVGIYKTKDITVIKDYYQFTRVEYAYK